MLVATLAGVQMGLSKAEVPHNDGGVEAAMAVLDAVPAPDIAA